MRSFAGRLRRLEKQFAPTVESREARAVLARLEAARLRCRLARVSGERMAELRGMTVAQILNSSRRRAAVAREVEGDSDPARGQSAISPAWQAI